MFSSPCLTASSQACLAAWDALQPRHDRGASTASARAKDEGGRMAGYVVGQNFGWTDQAAFEEYRTKVNATIERYGGRFLIRGMGEALEGDWQPRLVVIEFPSVAQARSWYD